MMDKRRIIGQFLIGGALLLVAIGLGVFLGSRIELPALQPAAPKEIALTRLEQTPVAPLKANPEETPPDSAAPIITPALTSIPRSATIPNVPFIEQAPHKNWDAVHEETCEEAAVLTVVHYLEGQRQPDADEIETELQNLIAWEERVLGVFEDTTAHQTARILSDYFGYGDRVRIIEEATLNDVKREVVAGRPVIVPAAGRLIGNRYFKVPGPIYHMTVVIGYDEDEIITNDPGTRRGNEYRYPASEFWRAVHDFVDRTDEGMATGAKRLIVVDAAAAAD